MSKNEKDIMSNISAFLGTPQGITKSSKTKEKKPLETDYVRLAIIQKVLDKKTDSIEIDQKLDGEMKNLKLDLNHDQ